MPEIAEASIHCNELVLDEKDAVDWVYRGEGAANIVLGYTGSSPAFVGRVLRVQKSPRSISQSTTGTSILSKHEKLVWKDIEDIVSSTSKEIAERGFVQNVMISLLGSEHIDAGVQF